MKITLNFYVFGVFGNLVFGTHEFQEACLYQFGTPRVISEMTVVYTFGTVQYQFGISASAQFQDRAVHLFALVHRWVIFLK